MTMTLEEIKKGMSDKVFSQIVDIFLRQSTILQMLTFDVYQHQVVAQQ